MDQIAISKFRAQWHSVMERVRETRQPIRVTKFGKPVVNLVPLAVRPPKGWVGCMAGSVEELSDIVGPVGAFGLWERRAVEASARCLRLDLGRRERSRWRVAYEV